MSSEAATKSATELQMSTKEDDAGGGSADARSESSRLCKLKRKSDEATHTGTAKKPKKHWKGISNRRSKVSRWKKFPKKPRSLDGDQKGQKVKQKRQRRMTESFNAPFNSTQFLMNDHVPDAIRHLDSKLDTKKEVVVSDDDDDDDVDYAMERPLRRITRARESSFSIDSDEDYFYSSPEDEEEFMSREFIKDYDSVRTDRLIDMSKSELINEYLQMEKKIDALEKCLNTNKEITKKEDNNEETIRQFQKEILRLETENDRLKTAKGCSSCSCSSDEQESGSDSDSSSSSSSSSEDEEEEITEPILIKKLFQDVSAQDDTGYESGQSKANGLDPNEEKEVVVNHKEANVVTATATGERQMMISVNCITSTSPWSFCSSTVKDQGDQIMYPKVLNI